MFSTFLILPYAMDEPEITTARRTSDSFAIAKVSTVEK